MKRLAVVCAVISALLLIDGLIMVLINYHPGDQNAFTGNGNLILSDGDVTLISGGFFLLATALIWIVAQRRERGTPPERRSASRAK